MEWSEIKPLKEDAALKLVSDYFQNHFFQCRKIDSSTFPEGQQSPDFEVFSENSITAYCEVKTPYNKLHIADQMYHWDTGFNKLRNFIGTAADQLIDQDPEHRLPRILAFTSNHPQLNWTTLAHNLNEAVAFNGQVIKDFRNRSYIQDSNRKLASIDLFIWMQVSYVNPEIYQMAFFINTDSLLYTQANEIAQKLKPLPGEKIKLASG